ncbi:hypothetical protein ADK33_21670 [Streptomyces griseus subsp. rhodochrous]|nr:hypothetical protein ADK33_21670 [Streptomyces griseus subsp. rhodochrous]
MRLAGIVRAAVEERLDMAVYEAVLEREEEERTALLRGLETYAAGGGSGVGRVRGPCGPAKATAGE